MELLIFAVIVILAVLFYVSREPKKLDVNNDGKVDAEDLKVAVEKVTEKVQEAKKATRGRKPAAKKAK